jgi:acetylornithine deacetylase
VKREVEAHVAGIAAADSYLAEHPPRIEGFLDADRAEVPPDHPILPAIGASAEAVGLPSAFVGFGALSDLGIPTNAGTPTRNFGPGDPTLADQPNERIPLAELVACAKVLATTLRNWCT